MKSSTQPTFVAGHRGLVGTAVQKALLREGHGNVVTRTRAELDLRDQAAVDGFFDMVRPACVYLCAATVGGIKANATRPADFVADNLTIQSNVIGAARRTGVQKLIFLGSSCIYPRDCPQPMHEDALLTGPLEATNRAYAIAKIAGIELCWAFNRQYGCRYIALMPTNLFGPGDNYDLQGSHVLPALIRKMHDAKEAGRAEVILWGTGSPLREFLHSDDLAEAAVFLASLTEEQAAPLFSDERPPLINVGFGAEISIRDLATTVAEIVGFEGAVCWDTAQPDGTPRKLLDSSRIRALGWRPRISLKDGIAAAYKDFLDGSERVSV